MLTITNNIHITTYIPVLYILIAIVFFIDEAMQEQQDEHSREISEETKEEKEGVFN